MQCETHQADYNFVLSKVFPFGLLVQFVSSR